MKTLETYACNRCFRRNVTLLLGRTELILVELDVGAKLDATKCSKVADAELGDGTGLGSGYDRWMEHGHDGRRESRRWVGGTGRARPTSEGNLASEVHPAMAGDTG
jgi:hypothetical protein